MLQIKDLKTTEEKLLPGLGDLDKIPATSTNTITSYLATVTGFGASSTLNISEKDVKLVGEYRLLLTINLYYTLSLKMHLDNKYLPVR